MIRSMDCTRSILLLIVVFLLSCSTPETAVNTTKWSKKTFGEISYKIPSSWKTLRTKREVQYTKFGSELQTIGIAALKKGQKYPNLNLNVDPELDPFTLIERAQREIKQRYQTISFELQEQKLLKDISDRSFLFRAQIRTPQPMGYVVWYIGIPKEETLYQITLKVEQYADFSTLKSTYGEFISHLVKMNSKKNGKKK